MAQYLYRTIIYKNPTTVNGLDTTVNASALSDFENTRKSSAIKITDLALVENTFIVDEDYASFAARINQILDGITWSDVKYIESNTYKLLLLI